MSSDQHQYRGPVREWIARNETECLLIIVLIVAAAWAGIQTLMGGHDLRFFVVALVVNCIEGSATIALYLVFKSGR